jgi:hypothetical protein
VWVERLMMSTFAAPVTSSSVAVQTARLFPAAWLGRGPRLAAKGRLIRCTVPRSTPNRLAMTRTPGRPGVATALEAISASLRDVTSLRDFTAAVEVGASTASPC